MKHETAPPDLSEDEIERYSRQLILKQWSSSAQLRLRSMTITLPTSLPAAALYLAAAGVGSIRLVETETGGAALAHRVQKLNPLTRVETVAVRSGDDRTVSAITVEEDSLETFQIQIHDNHSKIVLLRGVERTVFPQPSLRHVPTGLMTGLSVAALVLRETASAK